MNGTRNDCRRRVRISRVHGVPSSRTVQTFASRDSDDNEIRFLFDRFRLRLDSDSSRRKRSAVGRAVDTSVAGNHASSVSNPTRFTRSGRPTELARSRFSASGNDSRISRRPLRKTIVRSWSPENVRFQRRVSSKKPRRGDRYRVATALSERPLFFVVNVRRQARSAITTITNDNGDVIDVQFIRRRGVNKKCYSRDN